MQPAGRKAIWLLQGDSHPQTWWGRGFSGLQVIPDTAPASQCQPCRSCTHSGPSCACSPTSWPT
ncbi:alpha-2-HS-glycoprotein, isoform CRA_a [Rattus norvegicus]|uniref:Alpha-2-HS-glycoprotein, isoform CRA_a n=1 Tax=Rattus norvegicus TaxID=10116 RepID=A6JS50_RAT|nr:alpha-2-HS-glycoprotein, isoform CRA_a [Rattus norvegicus]